MVPSGKPLACLSAYSIKEVLLTYTTDSKAVGAVASRLAVALSTVVWIKADARSGQDVAHGPTLAFVAHREEVQHFAQLEQPTCEQYSRKQNAVVKIL